MKKILLFLLVFVSAAQLHAQRKRSYYILPQVALLNGNQYASAQVGISGGLRMKGYSIGIGAAVDYYKMRTVPVFAELRAGIGKSAFVFVNGGANIPWALATQETTHWIPGTYMTGKDQFNTGLYGDAGIGYKCPINAKKDQFLVSIGYSMKTIHQRYTEAVYNPTPPYVPSYTERKLDYTLNRLVIRVGVEL